MSHRANHSVKDYINAYKRYCDEFSISKKGKRLDLDFYREMQVWLAAHGCEYKVMGTYDTAMTSQFKWESQSKQVEFFLKWM